MALATKLLRGSGVTLIEHALKLALMFVITPLMIHHLGERDYGTWLLALAIVAYLRLLDLGLSFSGARFLGKAIGAGDRESYRDLVATLTWLFRWIGLGALAVAGLAWWLIPLWMEESATRETVRWLVLGFGFLTAINFWTAIFETVLKSHVRYDLIGIASLGQSAIQGALILWALLSGHGLATLFTIFLATDLGYRGLLVVFARRLDPSISLSLFRSARPTRIRPLLRYSVTAMATSTSQGLRNGIDPLVIERVASVSAIPAYSIGARFLSVFTDLVNAIFGGNFVAAFSQLHGRGETHALKKNFLASIRHCSAIAALGGGALLIYGPAFIERWVGPDFSRSATVLFILTPATVLSLAQYPIWGFFYSQDRQHWLAGIMLAGGIFNVILSFSLAAWIGFFGVVWATLIEMSLVFGIIIPILVVRVTGIPWHRYLTAIARGLAPVALASLAVFWLMRNWIAPDYGRILALAVIQGIVILPLIWFLALESGERGKVIAALPRRTHPSSER